MKQRLTYLLPFVAAAAIVAANGCGDDDDDDLPNTNGSSGRAGSSGRGGSGGGTQGAGGSTQGAGGGTQGAGGGTQGAGGEGGATQGAGGGGSGGAPTGIPTDTCDGASFTPVQANGVTLLANNQQFGTATDNFDFVCGQTALKDGPDLVMGATSPGTGLMRLRTSGEEIGGLDVGLVLSSQCQSGIVNTCSANAPSQQNLNEQLVVPVVTNQSFYLFARNLSQDPQATAGKAFSVDAQLLPALTPPPQANTCAGLGAPLELQPVDPQNPATELIISGTTFGSGGEETVPTIGSCNATSVPKSAAGEEQVIAVRPLASGTLVIGVQRPFGDTRYRPVLWARQGACDATGTPVTCAVEVASGLAFVSLPNVTANEVYYIFVDSQDATAPGSYVANIRLFVNNTVTVDTETSALGTRVVERDSGGRVMRVYAPPPAPLKRRSALRRPWAPASPPPHAALVIS